MESVGRMTRSKARALGATPVSAIPSKPESKTTGRRRKATAQAQEPSTEEAAPRQLNFPEEPPVQQQVPANPLSATTEGSEPKITAATSPGQSATEGTLSDREATVAEGVPKLPRPDLAARTPLNFTSDAPRHDVLATVQPMAVSIPASPLSITAEAIEEAIFSPMPDDDVLNSPISLSGDAEFTLQLTPPLMPQLADDDLDLEDLERVDDGDEMMSEATPVAGEPGVGAMAGSPLTFVSDRRATTPATAPSPAPSFAGVPPDSMPHASASPAPLISSFQGFAAVFPTPSGFALEPNSPSLAGLMSASALSPSVILMSAGPTDPSAAPTPSTIASEHDSGAASVTVTGAAAHTSASSTAATVATPFGANTDAESSMETANVQPASDNLTFSPVGACLPPAPAPTPESGALPGWTLAQTPLVTALAVSASGEAIDQCDDVGEGNEADGVVDKVERDSDLDVSYQIREEPTRLAPEGTSPMHDMETEGELPPRELSTPAAITPQQAPNVAGLSASVAKVAPFQGRSPAVGSIFRTTSATPTGKMATKAGTPARSSYITVESRYNKTPTTGATAARPRPSVVTASTGVASSTPVATTYAAPGAKSVKRVSIHTPEGPRSVAAHRQVVPTPFRPKSASQPSVPPSAQEALAEKPVIATAVEQVQAQTLHSQPSAAAEERRAKAADRLKAIHATEQGLVPAPAHALAVRPSLGPGYLAPTQAFVVKSSVKVLKSRVDGASYDPRSLRQLKRDVKDAIARKEAKVALTEARNSKLTPKVHERQLPMPDDEEDSEDQVEYNEGQENDLVAAMTGLAVAPSKAAPVPLRGVPAPQGRHIRFDDKGKASESPQRTVLRGLPVATGKYKRFE